MKKPKVLHNFYKSPAWLEARSLKIMSVNGLCERCGQAGIEVHHKTRLTVQNYMDTSISLNQEKLELLCRQCHNSEHNRFSKQQHFDEDGNLISR